jgi:Transposase IS116/IS110/IS902 family
VLLYDIHDIARFPRGQAFAAYGRLVTCATEAAGQRSGTSGANIGNAHRTWAFSEAAVFCVREHPAGQKFLAKLEKKPSQGKALTIVAHTWARAVYAMLKRTTAFDMHTFLQAYGRGVGELHAELDSRGMSRFINARPCVKHGVLERP